MRVPCLSVLLLAVAAFSFSTALEPRFQEWEGDRHVSDNILQAALGDGRKLFAKHFYTKADVYFHNGYYPTIYDANEDFKQGCVAGGAHHAEQEEMEDFLGPAKDWIDALISSGLAPTDSWYGRSDVATSIQLGGGLYPEGTLFGTNVPGRVPGFTLERQPAASRDAPEPDATALLALGGIILFALRRYRREYS